MPEKYNRNQLKQMDKADLIDLIEALFARIETLQNQMQQQSTRTKHLENQLAKTSQNSSKPPSSDGNGEPGVYEQRRGESQVDKRAIPVIPFYE